MGILIELVDDIKMRVNISWVYKTKRICEKSRAIKLWSYKLDRNYNWIVVIINK